MTVQIPFDNTYAQLPDNFYTRQPPTAVAAPRMLAVNTELGHDLGISFDNDESTAEIFAGNVVPEGADPLAQIYSGHQFGNYNPQLGDGRALLLGEVVDRNGQRRDVQLKGSGPTPYSRMGDGRAWLGPVLREYVVSEAMHHLGVPTTRALAAVSTGEQIYRETVLPGAVLTRVAASHIRVGTFQLFAHRGQLDDLKRLTDYTIARHFPKANNPMDLLREVASAQAALIPAWMSLGFIHGVMNTDNCTISGETIDYGPCAFLDKYDPNKVFSSIDQMSRYAFSNQPRIIVWNMAQFATALIQQMDDSEAAVSEATEIVHAMPAQIEANWLQKFGAKIGLEHAEPSDTPLIEDLLSRMAASDADFTNTFRALLSGNARDQFTDPTVFDEWEVKWRDRIASENTSDQIMAANNPAFIPRNHRIEEMIQSAVSDDFDLFKRLTFVLARPFDDHPEHADLARAPSEQEIIPATFCGT